MKLLTFAAFAATLAACSAPAPGPRFFVTETAGLAREHEPVTVTLDGAEQTLFVTIGANESREFALAEMQPPGELRAEPVDEVSFRLENALLAADHSAREAGGRTENSGTLRALTFKPSGVTLLRTQNRMHWAPSFQRAGAQGYTSLATWDPVQKAESRSGPGWFAHTRSGRHALYPEIELRTEYRYFAGVPYFLFEATMEIVEPIEMFWLRGQEMTMDAFFTHVAFPGRDGAPRIVDFEQRRPILEHDPLPVDVPWVAFLHREKGYGFGAVTLHYSATTTANPHTTINDGADNGKYWDRHLVSRTPTPLKPGDRYEERTAYVLFRAEGDDPLAEFLDWERRLRNPLTVEPR